MVKEETQNETSEATEEQKPQFENKVTIEEAGPCMKKITVEVPPEAITAAIEEQFSKLKRDAAVPGFRRGRAPLRLLEKRFGSDVRQQVKLKLLADTSQKAIDDNKIDMLGDPEIDHESVELPDEGPMTFSFEVEVRPDFKLPKLEGIEIQKPRIEITDKQLDDEIQTFRERAGLWVPKEGGKVEPGDQIIADAVLIIDGVEEHEKRDNIEIFARERGFVGPVPVEGLDKLLKGAKDGDEKKTTVEIPETYFNQDYRGKKVDVQITVKEVKKLELAELNEDFFKRFNVDSLDELKDVLREARQGQAEQDARTAMGDQIYEYLLEEVKLDLPASIVADQSTRLLQRQFTQMLLRGTPREEIEQHMQELRASSEEQATEQLKQLFIMGKIAEELGIEVSEEEVNGYVAQVAAQRNRRPEKMREELARDGSLAQFTIQIREQKCIEKLLESAKINEVEPDKMKPSRKKTVKKAAPKKADAPAKEDKKAASVKKAAKKEDPEEPDTREKTAAKRTKKAKKADKKGK
ncbi:MAG: trigger factor [Sedimentisphaerales bacterium]|nr:trigger factor [Sedimentisphaerales bacterium]